MLSKTKTFWAGEAQQDPERCFRVCNVQRVNILSTFCILFVAMIICIFLKKIRVVQGLESIVEDPSSEVELENLEEKICQKFAGKYKPKVSKID